MSAATIPRSYLYVPGDRPDRLARAFERGADAIIVDLEDAVAEADKDAALATVLDWIPDRAPGELWLRVAAASRRRHELAMLADSPAVTGFLLAKVDGAGALTDADRVLSEHGSDAVVSAIIESAAALEHVRAIAGGPRVRHIQLGEADLRADLRLPLDAGDEALMPARLALVYAAAAAGIRPPVASASRDYRDLDALRASTARARALGFVGRTCIHPSQIPVVNEVLTPSADELARAAAVVSAYEAAGGSAVSGPDGTMLDLAVVRSAQLTLGLAPR